MGSNTFKHHHGATHEPHGHTGVLVSTWEIMDGNYNSTGEVTALSQSSVCSKHFFFYRDMSLSALRMPLKQGTHPGQLYSSWMLYSTIWNHTWTRQQCLGVPT